MMLLAAAFAGMGFGNAGVHLPHAMSYPVSGMVRDYRPGDYPVDHPVVPHGMSVILNAPAAFRFTASACPERHLESARALGANIDGASLEDAGAIVRRAHHLVHEATRHAQRPFGRGLRRGRCAPTGRRHATARAADETLAPAGGGKRTVRDVLRCDDVLVVVRGGGLRGADMISEGTDRNGVEQEQPTGSPMRRAIEETQRTLERRGWPPAPPCI